ncbi:MAG: hypothetical protein KGS72_00150 [Cyanobacteria bacterium REEB67]|nr:hypothetical protein [Cyanobacteria bacterium REEB67]
MNNETNAPTERNIAAAPTEMGRHEAVTSQSWADLSANLWGGRDLLANKDLAESDANKDGSGGESANDAAAQKNSKSNTAEAYLPPMDLSELKNEALHDFDRLDSGHAGFLSKEQMAASIDNDPSIKGDDAIALAALYNIQRHERPSQVPPEVNLQAMTRTEVENLPTSLADEKLKLHELKTIEDPDLQSTFDPNNTGRISEASVGNVLGDKMASQYEALAEGYAAQHLTPAEQAQVRVSGLTQQEMNGLDKEQTFRVTEAKEETWLLNHAQASLGNKGSGAAFENTANPVASINQNDVTQGASGDCYFDSALAAVAKTQPEIIANSIKLNENGTYTVTFKGDPQHPIDVEPPTDSELSLYNSASADGTWANIIEKAYADHQILFGGRKIADDTEQDAISAGNAGRSLALLTGEPAPFYQLAPGQAARMESEPIGVISPLDQLEAAASQGAEAMVGIGNAPDGSGLASHHEYTVVGYQPGANGGNFELRNPWNDSTKYYGSYFSISADQLAPGINNIAFEANK